MFRLFKAAAIDLELARGWRAGRMLSFGPREVDLLDRLLSADGAVVPRDELLKDIFGFRLGTSTRALDVAISRLRGKLEVDPARPEHLVTARGVGYSLDLRHAAETAHRGASLPGRGDLLRELSDAIAQEGFVTLWGPAGVGKSRVAQALAELHRGGFEAAGGVVRICDLEGVQRLGQLRAAIGSALRLSTGEVGQALSARPPTLLVLDSADDLPWESGAEFAAWMQQAPDLRLVLCSRDRLRSDAEHAVPVAPLDGPSARRLLQHQGLDFDEPVLDAIAQHAERLPAALLRAAGHLRDHTSDEAHALLGGEGALTTAGSPLSVLLGGADEVGWSHVSPRAAALLCSLSCFRGGFDVAGAAALVPDEPGWGVADLLDELVDRSLLLRDDAGRRFHTLRTVREAAARRLSTHDPSGRALRAHADFVLRRVELLAAGLGGRHDAENRRVLAAEVPNARAAITAMAAPAPLVALRIRMALIAFHEDSTPADLLLLELDALAAAGLPTDWVHRVACLRVRLLRRAGRLVEAIAAGRAALATSQRGVGPELTIRVERELCSALLANHELEACLATGLPALRHAQKLGGHRLDAQLACTLAHAQRRSGDLMGAKELAGRALGIADRRGMTAVQVDALRLLAALAADEGRIDEARRLRRLEQREADRLDDSGRRALAALSRGFMALRAEQHGPAVEAFEFAIQLARAAGAALLHGDAVHGLAWVDTDRGRRKAATRSIRLLRHAAERTGHPLLGAYAHHRAGCLALDNGDAEDAGVEMQRSLELYRRHDLSFGLGRVLLDRASVFHLQGSLDAAKSGYDDAFAVLDESTDRRGLAECLVRRALLGRAWSSARRDALAGVGDVLLREGAADHHATWAWVAGQQGVGPRIDAPTAQGFDARLARRLAT